MDKIIVEICQGTTCVLMGSSEILAIEDNLPASWRERVSVNGVPCLERCREDRYGSAPFVSVDGEVLDRATAESLMERLKEKMGAAAQER